MNLNKTNLYGNRKYVIIFLRRLQSRVAKKSSRKDLLVNYFIFKKMLNTFKLHNKLYLYRHFFQIKKTNFFLNPIYKFTKQFFTKKTFFDDFLKENFLKGFFINKFIINNSNLLRTDEKINYMYGYNYYVYNSQLTNDLKLKLESENVENFLKIK
jgi:hypothetical protein